MDSLSVGSLLQSGKYKILKVLGQGGFGITYLAEQVALGRKVAIKEFFMKDYCDRNDGTSHVSVPTENSRDLVNSYKQKFVKEAQMIASLRNSHIVSIHDIFEENGTAYYVMDYLNNGSLIDIIKQRGPLSEADAIQYIIQIGDALSYIHDRNILHLDVKPANILLNDDGSVVLIDFGISKRYDESGGQTSTTPVGISKGYAPIEQYQQGSVTKFSPATDVYSLGATLFFLLSGKTPPEAAEVYEDGLPDLGVSVSSSTKDAISMAMKPNRKERLQRIQSFVNLLCVQVPSTNEADSLDESKVTVAADSIEQDEETVIPFVEKPILPETDIKGKDKGNEEPIESKKKRVPAFIWAIFAFVLIGCVCFFALRQGNQGSPKGDEIRIAGQTDYSVSFSNAGDSRSLAYSKSFPEEIEFHEVPDWCRINLYNKKIVINCLSNDTGKERTAVIPLSRSGKTDILATISVSQIGKTKQRNNEAASSNGQRQEIQASSIQLKESRIELRIGESHAIKYSITPTEASTHKVVWSSSNTAIASVDAEGVVVARGQGITYISAAVDGVSSSCAISVVNKNESESSTKKEANNMYLAREEVTLYVGQTITMHAFNYGNSLRWESSNEEIATVSSNGVVSALKSGTVTIRAIGKEVKTCKIIIKNYSSTTSGQSSSTSNTQAAPTDSEIGLNKPSLTLQVGESTVLRVNGYNGAVTWESENTSVATVNQYGLVKGVQEGGTIVWARCGSVAKMCKVQITASSSSSGSGNSNSGIAHTHSTQNDASLNAAVKRGMEEKRKISGYIKDTKGDPIVGASIMIKGTTTGTVSDVNGYYTIWAKFDDAIVVSSQKYISQEKLAASNTIIDFTLQRK